MFLLKNPLAESVALLLWATFLLAGAAPFDSAARTVRCDGTTISCAGNVMTATGTFPENVFVTGGNYFQVTGTNGNIQLAGSGSVFSFTRNGYNYVAADGSNATLVIQADGTSGTVNRQANTMNDYASNGTTLLASLTTSLYAVGVPIQLVAYTVSTLPSCASGIAGAIAYVTDASSPTYNGALTGGSSTKTLAMCNGSSWVAH